jgi:diguanylate cyclase (GGDEF)-like protein
MTEKKRQTGNWSFLAHGPQQGKTDVTPADTSIIAEIKSSGHLPSPTGVALSILELTRDPNTSIDEMAKILCADPSLSGQIIKYANSAAAGNRKSVATVNDALVRLGMRMVRQLCLGFSVLSNTQGGHCENFDYERFWAHSLAMATSCQTLAATMGSISPEEGFTCGLLAEIGGLALASVYPEKYSKVLAQWGGGNRTHLLELELEELSITRNQVTASLFEDWGLPAFYPLAVLNKDDTGWTNLGETPSGADSYAKLANLLFAGNLAADICIEKGKERHWRVLDFQNFARLFHLGDEEFVNIYDEILEEWARMGKILDVVTGQVPSMADMLRKARNANGGSKLADGIIDDRHAPAEPQLATIPEADLDFDVDEAAGLRILVATDCPLQKKILTRKLADLGHEMMLATDGRQALEMAVANAPQLIISDWDMSGLDGLELCRTLRSSPQLAHIHFILMTKHDTNDELVEAFDAGINYYLNKPVNHRILAALLQGAAREVVNREEVQRQKEALRRTNSEVNITNRMLKTMALEDQLTQLPNRRAGLEALDKAWSKSTRDNEPLLVMILDIDFFKKVNDNHGHDAGDIVLRETAAAMKNAIRDYDEICRFGGEEFMVVCPGAGVDVAAMVGNRIRATVEKNRIERPEFTGGVTVSVGAAVREEGIASPKDLLKLADEALYAAKGAGRNKVCIFSLAPSDA